MSLVNALEAESFVERLSPFSFDKIGTNRWNTQREWFEQLNLSAHHSAINNQDEFVVDKLMSHEKIPIVIHELLVIELFKAKVIPLLKEEMIDSFSKGSMKPYMLVSVSINVFAFNLFSHSFIMRPLLFLSWSVYSITKKLLHVLLMF